MAARVRFADVMLRVPTMAAYLFKHARAVRANGATVEQSQATLVMFISDGRAVANCECGAGVAIHPEWPWAGCFTCGRTYTSITVPDNWRAIVEALQERPMPTQRHWIPGESVDVIRLQTAVIREATR